MNDIKNYLTYNKHILPKFLISYCLVFELNFSIYTSGSPLPHPSVYSLTIILLSFGGDQVTNRELENARTVINIK